jgi:hypothetical protein
MPAAWALATISPTGGDVVAVPEHFQRLPQPVGRGHGPGTHLSGGLLVLGGQLGRQLQRPCPQCDEGQLVPEGVVQLGGEPAAFVQPGPLGDVFLLAFELLGARPLGLDEEGLLTPVPPGEPGQHDADDEDEQGGGDLDEVDQRDGPTARDPHPEQDLPTEAGATGAISGSCDTYSASVRVDASRPMSTELSAIPDVWFSSCRTVMPCGNGSHVETGLSRSISSVRTAAAVNDLLTDATRIGVSAVTGWPSESCPAPVARTISSPCVTTTDTPGRPVDSRASWTYPSIEAGAGTIASTSPTTSDLILRTLRIRRSPADLPTGHDHPPTKDRGTRSGGPGSADVRLGGWRHGEPAG